MKHYRGLVEEADHIFPCILPVRHAQRPSCDASAPAGRGSGGVCHDGNRGVVEGQEGFVFLSLPFWNWYQTPHPTLLFSDPGEKRHLLTAVVLGIG